MSIHVHILGPPNACVGTFALIFFLETPNRKRTALTYSKVKKFLQELVKHSTFYLKMLLLKLIGPYRFTKCSVQVFFQLQFHKGKK